MNGTTLEKATRLTVTVRRWISGLGNRVVYSEPCQLDAGGWGIRVGVSSAGWERVDQGLPFAVIDDDTPIYVTSEVGP